ncbi:MAG: twin-arginine translocase TatA/TatE family subunit [Candidatus Marinimicrobia bacterium]|nr:twin-arginine translocase TatA/TatE family subunit [Candidatus Neomarinimicrobiota bacterium]MCF7839154.1 twin-arginine translocase TatA/TatE family subunit [Candidatus Neomarinimicrobiota bacterium]MCF7902427.1 twin-arginine translocase TatA/TatE family subunit [Candidatus Neomarinimicrobiota bacterium]
MSFPGGWELLIILLFVLIFFGAKRLPEMARGLGKGIREFKGAISGITDEVQKAGQVEEKKDTTGSDSGKAADQKKTETDSDSDRTPNP